MKQFSRLMIAAMFAIGLLVTVVGVALAIDHPTAQKAFVDASFVDDHQVLDIPTVPVQYPCSQDVPAGGFKAIAEARANSPPLPDDRWC